ncbi:MAG: hypothetical protein AUI50_04635 [Crenarchaeota archaeon 13_1_40CM_2_52_14]|nr:MAG: hypothetical protein AUI50_04635 [Crenarchaeota archaeon 13_1_40CM_2_52_14]
MPQLGPLDPVVSLNMVTRICERKSVESGQIIWPDSRFSFFEFNIIEPFRSYNKRKMGKERSLLHVDR